MRIHEETFRIVALGVLVAFGLVWSINLVRIGISREVFYSRHESLRFALFSRGLVVANLVGLILYVAAPQRMAWSQLPLPWWLRLAGLPVAGGGVLLFWWVLAALGRNFSMSVTIEGHTLVTDGPYHWVRHPMYTAFFMVYGGLFLVSANWFVGASVALLYGTAMIVRIPQEERLLVDAFGEQYLAYMERTGRFLPKAGRLTRR